MNGFNPEEFAMKTTLSVIALLPMGDLEYAGIVCELAALEPGFRMREAQAARRNVPAVPVPGAIR